jgi:hypothetical protein
MNGDMVSVTAYATDKTGRTDADLGVVSVKGKQGDNLANAMMKAVTKAKRRVTLSICGLGWLDESELETVPTAAPVVVTDDGEILDNDTPGKTAVVVKEAEEPTNGVEQQVMDALDNDKPTNSNKHDMTPPANETLAIWHEKALTTRNQTVATVCSMVANAVPYFDNEHHVYNYVDDGLAKNDRLSQEDAVRLFDDLVEAALRMIDAD